MCRNAIPTCYRGINFRSRLEAKWAAFFDELRWNWQYEPVDFNGWIPDFSIKCNSDNLITYVEVKPVFYFPSDVADKINKAYPEDKCPRGESKDVLIVGAEPYFIEDEHPMIGWLRDYGSWDPAPFMEWKSTEILGFCSSVMSFTDRISGCHSGNWGEVCVDTSKIDDAWAIATNASQWKPVNQ
jgi:hypothetical protein